MAAERGRARNSLITLKWFEFIFLNKRAAVPAALTAVPGAAAPAALSAVPGDPCQRQGAQPFMAI
jgi:hypothetical protein